MAHTRPTNKGAVNGMFTHQKPSLPALERCSPFFRTFWCSATQRCFPWEMFPSKDTDLPHQKNMIFQIS